MNDIDWSKAPEGATHAGIGNIICWYKDVTAEGFQWRNAGMSHWVTGYGLPSTVLQERPSPAWVGLGVPRVGTGLEFLSSDLGDFWCEGTVSYVGPKFIVVTYAHPTAGESEACMNHTIAEPPLSTRIRPVRTPEQKRLDAIDVMCKDCGYDGGGASFYTCAGLYDAGYRKQVKP